MAPDQVAQVADEANLRGQIAERVRAIRARDLDAVLVGYAPEVMTFDVISPLVNQGVDAVRKRLSDWFGSFASDIEYNLLHVAITLSGDVAFDHHLTHVRGTSLKGDEIDMWFRETIGYRKRENRWLVTHQHSSVPFDMTTGKAQLDLKP